MGKGGTKPFGFHKQYDQNSTIRWIYSVFSVKRNLHCFTLPLLLIVLACTLKANMLVAKAAPPIYQGDLVLSGNDLMTIEDVYNINGSIVVEGNATLILNNAIINFTQSTSRQYDITLRNPANGRPRLQGFNSVIMPSDPAHDIVTYLRDNSTATFNNCTITSYIDTLATSTMDVLNVSSIQTFYAYEQSTIIIRDSEIGQWLIYDSPTVQAFDSTVNSILLGPRTADCQIDNLQPGLISNWNFFKNCTVYTHLGRTAPNVTLANTQVNAWRLAFYGSSNAQIGASTISDLSALLGSPHVSIGGSAVGSLYLQDSATVDAGNSTITSVTTHNTAVVYISYSTIGTLHCYETTNAWMNETAFTHIYGHNSAHIYLLNSNYADLSMMNTATAYVGWNLDVRVADNAVNDFPNANATAYYTNSTLAETALTNTEGWARLLLIGKTINITGEHPLGNYTVEATYNSKSDQETVKLDDNKQIYLQLDMIIPEYQPILLVIALATATLAAAATHRKTRKTT